MVSITNLLQPCAISPCSIKALKENQITNYKERVEGILGRVESLWPTHMLVTLNKHSPFLPFPSPKKVLITTHADTVRKWIRGIESILF